MGVRILQCFPWYRRRKEQRRKQKQEAAPPAAPTAEKPKLQSTSSVSSDTGSHQENTYYSWKARVSFRHQLDSTTSAKDSIF